MKPLSVLIVVDDRDFGQSLADVLEPQGHTLEGMPLQQDGACDDLQARAGGREELAPPDPDRHQDSAIARRFVPSGVGVPGRFPPFSRETTV